MPKSWVRVNEVPILLPTKNVFAFLGGLNTRTVYPSFLFSAKVIFTEFTVVFCSSCSSCYVS